MAVISGNAAGVNDTINGTLGDDVLSGNAAGVNDTINGARGDDVISGQSGDDVIYGGRGEDTVIGGSGSDVLFGGLDADNFDFSAGHLGTGEVDYIADFSLAQGDTLTFRNSGGGQMFEVLRVELARLTETDLNGIDLRNNVETGTDVIFTVRNSVTGAEQKIVVLDSWSSSNNADWVEYLGGMALSFFSPENSA